MTSPQPRPRIAFGRLGGRVGLGIVFLGLLVIALGYNGIAGNLILAAQLPYLLSGGFVGLALVVFGSAFLVAQSAREDRQRIEGLLGQLLEATTQSGLAAIPADVDGLFAAGTASFHLPTCRLVDGREEVSYLTATEAGERSLKPCRVCQPDTAGTNVTVR